MAHPHQMQTSPTMNFGQKLSNVAHTIQNIYSIGSTLYHVGKAVAPLVSALL
jgi:hypothetical protein